MVYSSFVSIDFLFVTDYSTTDFSYSTGHLHSSTGQSVSSLTGLSIFNGKTLGVITKFNIYAIRLNSMPRFSSVAMSSLDATTSLSASLEAFSTNVMTYITSIYSKVSNRLLLILLILSDSYTRAG